MRQPLLLPEERAALIAPLSVEMDNELSAGAPVAATLSGHEKEGMSRHAPSLLYSEERVSGDYFGRILDSLGQAVIATDRNGRVRYQNYGAKVLLGRLDGKPWRNSHTKVVRPGEEENDQDPVRQCLAEKRPVLFSTRLHRKDAGSFIPVAGEAFPVFLPTGFVDGVVISFRVLS